MTIEESLTTIAENQQAVFDAGYNKGKAEGGNYGVDGEDGATFTPSVSADGVLSWTNDKGLDNPAPVNIKGEDGVDGSSILCTSTGITGKKDSVYGMSLSSISYPNGKPPKVGDIIISTSTGHLFIITTINQNSTVSAKALGVSIKGAAGAEGATGNGISSIAKTSTSGLVDTYTITLTNGTKYTFTVTNGQAGATGNNGADGKDGTSVTITDISTTDADGGINSVTFSDGNILTIKNGSKGHSVVDGYLGTESENPIQNKTITKAINLMGKLVGMDETEEFVPSRNLCNPLNPGTIVGWYTYDDGSLTADGELHTDSQYNTSDFIAVTKGDTLVVSVNGNETTPGSVSSTHRVATYNESKAFVNGYQKTNPIVIPSGVAYIRVSVRSTTTNFQIEKGTEPTAYEPYREPPKNEGVEPAFYLNRDPIGYFRVSGNLADGDELTLSENNVRANTVVVFSCHIDTMNKLIVGEQDGHAPYLIIDNTNVEVHGTSSNTDTKPHGLTFGDNLLVRIESGADLYAKRITVTSGGNTFELTGNIKWSGDRKGAYVRSDGSTLTNCVLSWTCRNIAKPVWVFGDSYVSHGYSQRWPYHLYADGYGDALMLNGYAGEKSVDALTSLKNLLKIGRPQYIVWAMGMNDKDGTSAANSNWKSCFDEVVALCEQMNITLIACTIPQTPTTTTNNTYKNAIIRASGLRYVDFEEAVVKNTTTGEWYAGMRADEETNENCHPSTSGAKALYYRLLCDFPEIMTL